MIYKFGTPFTFKYKVLSYKYIVKTSVSFQIKNLLCFFTFLDFLCDCFLLYISDHISAKILLNMEFVICKLMPKDYRHMHFIKKMIIYIYEDLHTLSF